MKTFNITSTPIDSLPKHIDCNSILMLTDASHLLRKAASENIETIHCSLATMNTTKIAKSLHGKTIIINAFGYHQANENIDFETIKSSALAYFKLLKTIRAHGIKITLITLSPENYFLQGLIDGMAKSLVKETSQFHYKTIKAASISGSLTAAISTCISESSTAFTFHKSTLSKIVYAATDTSISNSKNAIKKGGTYLILGGKGGVGSQLCSYLAKKYQAKIYVSGRSPLTPKLSQKLKDIGAHTYLKVDVTNYNTLQSAVTYIEKEEGNIDGIFHLAGVLKDALFDTMTETHLVETLQPKVAGALNLARITTQKPINFICLFSSLTSVLGNFGQTAYAAANSCIDHIANYYNEAHSSENTIWKTINWGLWESEDGMKMEDQSKLLPMNYKKACLAMEKALESSHFQTIIYKGDLDITTYQTIEETQSEVKNQITLKITENIEAWLREIVFKCSHLKGYDAETSLITLGIDSPTAISIVSVIESDLKKTNNTVKLSKALLFEYASVADLQTFLEENYTVEITGILGKSDKSEKIVRQETATPAIPEKTAKSTTINLRGVKDWIQKIVVKYSGLKNIDDEDNLLQKGIDSVISINISTAISRQLKAHKNITLSKALLFEYASIQQIADYLWTEHKTSVEAVLSLQHSEEINETEKVSSPIKLNGNKPHKKKKTRKKGSQQQEYRTNDIAIVGFSGEFPGANSSEELWQLLLDEECAIEPIPENRWNWKETYTTDQNNSAKSYGRHGGFIKKAKEFDSQFFNMLPVEAKLIDPQERRLLHQTYQALENSGYFTSPTKEVGVFIATMFGHYQDLHNPTGALGGSLASIANRVSYTFDFKGPSLTLDSMCSGSLTSLHLASNSLRNKEIEVAVAGAVNIMPNSAKYKLLSQGKFLSPTGRCHSFGIEADGYVPGEGVVSVILKRVETAIEDNDKIYGIVRSTAVNSGGKSSGFTVPSVRAQADVIGKALKKAAISVNDIDYIETHGTGTALGDPIEIQGLQKVYKERTNAKSITLGAIKSNIGHLEAAAGFAGLIKLLLQLQHKTITPTIGCTIENPDLHLENTPFVLNKKTQKWKRNDVRFAGLSSFGAGGSNAHLILQECRQKQVKKQEFPQYIIPISAKNKKALAQRIQDLQAFISENSEVDMYSLAYTLSCAREHFPLRVCYIVDAVENLKLALKQQEDSGIYIDKNLNPDSSLQQTLKNYVTGKKSDFASIFPVKSILQLPNYPFSNKEYWISLEKNQTEEKEAITKEISKKETTDTPKILLAPQWIEKNIPTHASDHSLKDKVILFLGNEKMFPIRDEKNYINIKAGTNYKVRNNSIELNITDEKEYVKAFEEIADTHAISKLHFVYYASENDDVKSVIFAISKAVLQTSLHVHLIHIVKKSWKKEQLLPRALGGVFHTIMLEKQDTIQTKTLEITSKLAKKPAALLNVILEEFGTTATSYSHIRRSEQKREERIMATSTFSDSKNRFKENSTYIISGGMGMIGLALANRLATNYNATIILLGRSILSDEKEQNLAKLNTGKGKVSYFSTDITDKNQLQKTIAKITEAHTNVRGIIHMAAVLKDHLFKDKSREDFEQVLAVKVQGANNLHELTKNLELDFFTLFSSMSSILGNVGQADYVSANRYLDTFAAYRNELVARGKAHGHSLSINWPLWIDESEESREKMLAYTSLSAYIFNTYGIAPFNFDEGFKMCIDLINSATSETAQLMALKGDVAKIKTVFDKMEVNAVIPTKKAAQKTTLTKKSLAEIKSQMIAIISAITELSEDEIDDNTSWGNMGMSSVMLQKMATDIEKTFQTSVPPSIFFSYTSLLKFSEYLFEEGIGFSEDENNEDDASTTQEKTNEQELPEKIAKGYAIIGMDGQMPGGENLDDFWNLLKNKKSAIKKVARWEGEEYFAGVIDNIEMFDAKFFGLSAREAMLMDPQHRLFLQASYNTFLNAGYAPKELIKVGIFAGVQFNDYQTLLQNWGQSSHPYAATGNAHAMLANRVSYILDFRGPSQTIDTACSSALVALHRGIMALENQECEYALVGGVSLLIDNIISDAAKSMGVLSPNYRCATFDENADGYVRAEGVGCVLIKPLQKAIEDNDTIHAVIDASTENHGGKANSLTAPNPIAQEELLVKAYSPEMAKKVSYIETHGTGTKLGDPIEIDALKRAWTKLCPEKPSKSIALGAVKTNIGHLEPAAGIASLLKVLLLFKHKQLPANINFQSQNPYINLKDSPFSLLTESKKWESPHNELVAGISSFGFGGSNAHVVLREAPNTFQKRATQKSHHLITMSAKSLKSLQNMCKNMKDALQKTSLEEHITLGNIAYTLNKGRDHLEYRLAWIVKDMDELITNLQEQDFTTIERIKPLQTVFTTDLSSVNDTQMLNACKTAYLEGKTPDWNMLYTAKNYNRIPLPTYSFDTKKYWFENAKDAQLIS